MSDIYCDAHEDFIVNCNCREIKAIKDLKHQLKEANEKLAEKDKVIISQEKERQSTERFWKEKLEEVQIEANNEMISFQNSLAHTYEKKIKQLEQRLQEAVEVLQDLNKGVVRYYDETCSKVKWDTCCNGRDCACLGKPTDPEYYIWQDLLKVREFLKKIEAKEEA